MSFGTLYTYPKAPRATMCLYVAALNDLDVTVAEAWPIKVDPSRGGVGAAYLSRFPTGKVPALERPDGFVVYECIAVTWYLAKQNSSTTLLGRSVEEEATVLRWASFANSELLPPIMGWINPVIGKAPSGPEVLAKAEEGCEAMLEVVAREVFAKKWTEKHPEIHEYYWRIKSDPIYVKVDGEPYVLANVGDKAPA
ncbi:putative elongation factor 1-gamma [Diplodia seriata]|uniref:Putative elongation factor 1-gamma n=1 Tax=Diplodia seriata TaxID=420778 RepID=A0A0G2ESB9_9PEZI|nr:putative elongation factor 1-gamma [Diplodia seriata]